MLPASLMLQTFSMFSGTTDPLLATGRPFGFAYMCRRMFADGFTHRM